MKTVRKRSLIVASALLGALASSAAPSNAQTIDPRIGELKYENGFSHQRDGRQAI